MNSLSPVIPGYNPNISPSPEELKKREKSQSGAPQRNSSLPAIRRILEEAQPQNYNVGKHKLTRPQSARPSSRLAQSSTSEETKKS